MVINRARGGRRLHGHPDDSLDVTSASAHAVDHSERVAAWINSVMAIKGSLASLELRKPESVWIADARELYVAGKINLGTFEARLDAIFSRASA